MNRKIFLFRLKITNYLTKASQASKYSLKYNAALLFKIFSSALASFFSKDGFEKAATMTFYSLLSLVPLMAIAFGVAQFLGYAETLSELIKRDFSHQPIIADKMIQFAMSTLKYTRGDIIAAVGFFVLLWTVIRMFGSMENYFNNFWQIRENRGYWRQIKAFLPIIILFPLFLIGSSSLTLFIGVKLQMVIKGSVYKYLLNFIRFSFNWLWLSFLYVYIPNRKTPIITCAIGGFITAIFFSLWQWIYLTFQLNVASYGAIYGSFAAIPLFLIWLNYSWLIIFFGCELTSQIFRFNTAKKMQQNIVESQGD